MKKGIILSAAVFFWLSVHAQQQSEERVPCGGVERWSIKVLTDSDTSTVNFNPIASTIDSLVQIVVPSHNGHTPRMAGIEDKVYKVRCHITIKKNEDDEDYHLVLSDSLGNTLIAECPDPTCVTVSSSAYVSQFISGRQFVDTNIAPGNVYNVNLPTVEVTGVAFVDVPHGQTGAAPNQMELHPVLDIRFAPPIGIAELPQGILSVVLSPNPLHHKLEIRIFSKIGKLKNCELHIYNLLGSIAASYLLPVESGNSVSTTVNTTLTEGNYIYRVTSNHKSIYDGMLTVE